jgi:hypothetical protein
MLAGALAELVANRRQLLLLDTMTRRGEAALPGAPRRGSARDPARQRTRDQRRERRCGSLRARAARTSRAARPCRSAPAISAQLA